MVKKKTNVVYEWPLAQVATCSHGSARTDDHAISLHFVKPAPGGDLRSFRPKKLAAV